MMFWIGTLEALGRPVEAENPEQAVTAARKQKMITRRAVPVVRWDVRFAKGSTKRWLFARVWTPEAEVKAKPKVDKAEAPKAPPKPKAAPEPAPKLGPEHPAHPDAVSAMPLARTA